uniref:Thionin-like protein 2 n=1 Tax=Davidia involucrata TaxID=16924 RepID=A0A5B7C7R7_DAVIN
MEGGNLRSAVMIVLVLGLFVGQSTASFKKCYAKCFLFCMINIPPTVLPCAVKCLKDCIIPKPTHHLTQENTHYFCKLGCASSLCTNISTIQNPGEEKVESCIGSCSETCINNY